MAEEAAPNEQADPTPKKAAESTQAEGETKTVAQKPPARPETKKGAQAEPVPSSEGAQAEPAPSSESAQAEPAPSSESAQAAAAQPAEPELEGEPGAFGVWLHGALKATPSWLVSLVVHLAIILVLAMLSQSVPAKEDLRELVVGTGKLEELDELDELDDEPLEEIDINTTDVAFESQIEPEEVDIAVADDIQAAAVSVELSDIGLEHAPKNDLLASIGAMTGDALSGRGSARARMAAQGGGSDGSERAVAAALLWLATHQLPDGSWSFNHQVCPKCRGQCRNPGELAEARNAATGLALLPFLGAGQTHKVGKYRETVKNGLYFLVNRMKVSPQGGSLYEEGGRMYAHGIASIALCEAYAMSHDKGLYAPAQQAINYICYAQDPVGGGWRYTARQPGDTSVVGWQIMALKSGHMAYLRVPPITVKKAFTFLDTVQANNGANYGYTGPGKGDATTAIGLLCRMYLGWKKDNPSMERGVQFLSDKGPSNNVYYNYYATQVMRHWEGEKWTKWNNKMRDQLVNSQSKNGHEKGSWFLSGGKGHSDSKGGRLYHTAMCTMVLEVYYRHLPIYQKQSTEEDFPLD